MYFTRINQTKIENCRSSNEHRDKNLTWFCFRINFNRPDRLPSYRSRVFNTPLRWRFTDAILLQKLDRVPKIGRCLPKMMVINQEMLKIPRVAGRRLRHIVYYNIAAVCRDFFYKYKHRLPANYANRLHCPSLSHSLRSIGHGS